MLKYIYLHERLYSAYGVKVIVNQLQKMLKDAVVIHNLDMLPDDSFVVPYGLLESVEVIRNRRIKKSLALMVDAYSLGEWSNFQKCWSKSFVSMRYRFESLLKAIKYFILEYEILKKYDKVMLVSWGDKHYYEHNFFFKQFAHKIVVVPNGVKIPAPIVPHTFNKNGKIRIGCLSPWWGPSYYTLQFFLNEVWKKVKDKHNMELVIAGRGITPEKKIYMEGFENVIVIGEVDEIKVFYSQVDISLITMLKKCGIINRVLDGFSYSVPVLCRKESLLAFRDLPDCCYTYHDSNSFIDAINQIASSHDKVRNKTILALEYVRKNHDWDTNYQQITEYIEKCCCPIKY